MKTLLKDIRQNPVLWLVVFVPVVFATARLKPEAHTLLFVLAVLAIVPLAALLSHATESVAAKTGDARRLLHPWRTQAPRAGIQPSLRPTASGPPLSRDSRALNSFGGRQSRLDRGSAFTEKLSGGLAVLLILAYGLGMLFSLKTHSELFASVEHGEDHEAPWPIGLAVDGRRGSLGCWF